ncbi:ABC transporter substrate-binding protein [Gynuella sunshinyii]|uniref:Thiamine pyrimidine synthase n=1 Tax=Gynuella sunshinyii YC6258 TaxID=1445510 RepID=A0A0C5VRQ4_9GAMM|nr:ABC transporter substrate-binding protein [Gynuella sunshinyii]AJQ97302.1 ABC-type nitrate/sulfonate/bicarbonate transport system, periplasmic component [Gynuella sunshinyii YC6258]
MKKNLVSLVAGTVLMASSMMTLAADKLTLQLKWVTQAQFAGYYVALDKGFYKEEGLDLTIKPGGPDIAPAQVLAGGGADVIVDWLPSALATREKGLPMVNIAQIYGKSGMMLTCLKSSGIETPKDFAGKTLGVWFYGNEYPFLSWMSKLGYATDGSADGVKVLKQGFNVDPLFQGQADCVSTMTYNEYWQVLDGGMTPDELTLFKYEDEGVATLEDGLYVLQKSLDDPAMVTKLAKFLKASVKGWEWAKANPKEAALVVLEYDDTGAQTEEHQIRMMTEVAKLLSTSSKGMGYLDPAAYQRTVDVLLGSASTPVITKQPEGAYSHVVFDKAMAM